MMNEYILFVKDVNNEKIIGRLSDSNNTNGKFYGFIVFPHKSIKNPKPGLFKIDKLIVKHNKEKGSKYGFVTGEYVNTDNIDVKKFTNEQLYKLGKCGDYIATCRTTREHQEFMMFCDDMVFSVKNELIVLPYLNYISNHYEYCPASVNIGVKNSLKNMYNTKFIYKKDIQKHQLKNIFTKNNKVDLNCYPIMNKSKHKILWDCIIPYNDNYKCIALYDIKSDTKYNKELHEEIFRFNNDVNEYIRRNTNNCLKGFDSEDIKNIMNRLDSYSLPEIEIFKVI